jgi:hypothetical protein
LIIIHEEKKPKIHFALEKGYDDKNGTFTSELGGFMRVQASHPKNSNRNYQDFTRIALEF